MPCGIRMTHGTYLNRWSITAWHPKYSKCSWSCLNPCKPADAHPLILDDWRDNGSWSTTGVAGTCWESEKTTKQNINQLPVLTSPAAKPLKVFHRWTLVCKIQMASKNVRQKTLKDNFRQKLQNVFKGALKQSPKPCRPKSLDVLATWNQFQNHT